MTNGFHIHLVSDATGETINSIARACLVQFENVDPQEHFWSLIRTPRQLDLVIEGLRQWPGMVLYTFVDENLRHILQDYCRAQNIACISVLDPVLTAMASPISRRRLGPRNPDGSMRWTPNTPRALTRWIMPWPWMTAAGRG